MRKIEISINKAQLTGFSISLDNGEPSIDATVALLNNENKVITSYSISTATYNEERKFDLPIEIMPDIAKIAHHLEGVVARHCMKGQQAIGMRGVQYDTMVLDEYVPEVIDEVIDLSGIPF